MNEKIDKNMDDMKILIGILGILFVSFIVMSFSSNSPNTNDKKKVEQETPSSQNQKINSLSSKDYNPISENTNPVITRKYEISDDSCNKLEGIEKVDCYTELAIQKKDNTVCGAINDGFYRKTCIRHYALKFDPASCEYFGNDSTDGFNCWGELAIELDDINYCDQLINVVPKLYQSMCRQDWVFFKKYNDKSFTVTDQCEKIINPDIRKYCMGVSTGKSQYCDEIGNPDWTDLDLKKTCRECEKRVIDCRLFIDEERGKIRAIQEMMK